MNEQNLKRRGMGKKASQVGNADMGAFSDEFVKIIEKRAAIQNLIPGAIRASKFVRHPEEAMRGHDRLSRLGDWYVDRVNKKAIRAAKKKKRGDDILKALTGAK